MPRNYNAAIIKKLRGQLYRIAAGKRSSKQIGEIAGLLSSAFSQVGLKPVLVGGAAVELYLESGYATADLDMVLLNDPAVAAVMRDLDFERPIRGERSWHHPKLSLTVEFPSSSLSPGEDTVQVRSRYGVFLVISREDLAVDRLNSFAYWGSTVDGLNVLLLMMQDEFSTARFRGKLKGTELVPLAARLTRLRRNLKAGKKTFDEVAASLLRIIHDWSRRKP